MTIPRDTSRQLDEALARLNREHLLVIELSDLAHLLVEPDTEPFVPQRSPVQPGVDDLAATLAAAKALPDELTVRVILPNGASPDVPVAEAQAALRSRAAHPASVAWRDAMAVRNMGRRQLPLGLVVALLSWVIAYAAAAADIDRQWALGRTVRGRGGDHAHDRLGGQLVGDRDQLLRLAPRQQQSVGLRADRTMHTGDHLPTRSLVSGQEQPGAGHARSSSSAPADRPPEFLVLRTRSQNFDEALDLALRTSNVASTQPIPLIPLSSATEVVSPAIRYANTLLITCAAMPASRPPVRQTRSAASRPKASLSANSGRFWVPCSKANTNEDTTTPNRGLATRLPSARRVRYDRAA